MVKFCVSNIIARVCVCVCQAAAASRRHDMMKMMMTVVLTILNSVSDYSVAYSRAQYMIKSTMMMMMMKVWLDSFTR